ncbi:hypothetical protein RRG08_054037 [Elysia crispata]|uniref:Uncharacterized protein n=1 Tax=Elysia crispata TaxID=231223 RepID=A0AAE0ZA24_9GAST|nr:hypothetical protein RRG08_054037 [Elysia crispata]
MDDKKRVMQSLFEWKFKTNRKTAYIPVLSQYLRGLTRSRPQSAGLPHGSRWEQRYGRDTQHCCHELHTLYYDLNSMAPIKTVVQQCLQNPEYFVTVNSILSPYSI